MAELGAGHPVCIRVGGSVVESIDTIRLDHVVQYAHALGAACPVLESLADHPDGEHDLDWEGLVAEMQRLATTRPPERLAPILGLLRNDATRAAHMAETTQTP